MTKIAPVMKIMLPPALQSKNKRVFNTNVTTSKKQIPQSTPGRDGQTNIVDVIKKIMIKKMAKLQKIKTAEGGEELTAVAFLQKRGSNDSKTRLLLQYLTESKKHTKFK